MIHKGSYKVSISKENDQRLKNVKKVIYKQHPETYEKPEDISYNVAVGWMIDKLRESGIVP